MAATSLLRTLPVSAVMALIGIPAPAQDNSLYILQDNSTGGMSNSISVDQSAASLADVGSEDAPAEQLGGDNQADISIVGSGSSVSLSQRSVTSRVDGNDVSLDLIGSNLLGTVSQTGSGNSGTVVISGQNAEGALIQDGDDNTGTLSVDGRGVSGTLRQTGDDNTSALDVSGTNTSVTYEVIGNGLSGAVPPTVRSNGATVTVTQTGPGSVR